MSSTTSSPVVTGEATAGWLWREVGHKPAGTKDQ